jgi:hypothetical protein
MVWVMNPHMKNNVVTVMKGTSSPAFRFVIDCLQRPPQARRD